MAEPVRCAQHPDVETRLRCSSCETPICPACGREAAVGFKCPDCAAHAEGTTSRRDGAGGMFGRLAGSSSDRGRSAGSGTGGSPGERGSTGSRWSLPGGRTPPGSSGDGTQLPFALRARATLIGVAAAVVGGFVLGPVLQGGAFFLISAGVVGWGVARSVYWATEERNSPYVRALALALAVLTVAVGMGVAGSMTGGGRSGEIAFLAYPAAVYGGWIVVRQR